MCQTALSLQITLLWQYPERNLPPAQVPKKQQAVYAGLGAGLAGGAGYCSVHLQNDKPILFYDEAG